MIFTHETLTRDQTLSADVCVIGSGAGGAAAAFQLARQGKKVVILEAGSFLTPAQFSQREELMFPELYYDAGGRKTQDRAIRILHGHGVGGSTIHNINLCKRVPEALMDEWELPHLSYSKFSPYLDEIEKLLEVHLIDDAFVNKANRLFQKGAERLGYRGGLLKHNRKGCAQSGFCELGCAYDAKMNALRVLIPQAIRKGAQLYANSRALRIEWIGRKARKVHAEVVHPKTQAVQARLTIQARTIICAGGAIETPALLLRSAVPNRYGHIGSKLHLHPGVVTAGVFEERVEAWKGVPQSFECTEFLSFEKGSENRLWMITGAAHPAGAASLLPGYGEEHAELMRLYPNFLPLSAMVHDISSGKVVAKGLHGVSVSYALNDSDRAQLSRGLKETSKILLAAGAKRVIIPFSTPLMIRNTQELEKADLPIREHDVDLVSVHPMSSVWMGKHPESSCLDETGRYHLLDNLFVADASVYPTSLGVPPQVTTYAMGLYVADQVGKLV